MSAFYAGYEMAMNFIRGYRRWCVIGVSIFILIVYYLNSVVPIPKDSWVALALFMFVVLADSLFEIEKNTRPSALIPLYQGLDSAADRLRKILSTSTDEHDVIILGADGGATIHQILPLLRKSPATLIRVQVFLVDVDHDRSMPLQKKWRDCVWANVQAIQERLSDSKFELKISTYQHLPVLAGILVDSNHLFLGCHRWRGTTYQDLESADAEHVYFDRSAGGTSEYFCLLMENWTLRNPTCRQIYPMSGRIGV